MNATPNSLNLAAARVSYGRAGSIGEAWQQIRQENAETALKQEMKRVRYWRRISKEKHPERSRTPRENTVNRHRWHVFVNACYRAFFYITRRNGLLTHKSRAFYTDLRAILRKIYGRNLGKRAFARYSAVVFGLILAEREKKLFTKQVFTFFFNNRVSHPCRRNSIYYGSNTVRKDDTREAEHPLRGFSAENHAPCRGSRLKLHERDSKSTAFAVSVKGATGFYRRRLRKSVYRRLKSAADSLKTEHEGGNIYFSGRHAFNFFSFAWKNGFDLGTAREIYLFNLDKWEEIASTTGKTYVPSGLVSDAYEEILTHLQNGTLPARRERGRKARRFSNFDFAASLTAAIETKTEAARRASALADFERRERFRKYAASLGVSI